MKGTRKVRRTSHRLYRLCLIDGAADPGRVRQVSGAIARGGRRRSLAVLTEFQRLVRLDRQRHHAAVESAAPLPPQLRDEVRIGLTRLYGPRVELTFQQNPELLGGLCIRVGSAVYDGSVRAKLAALEARL
jgi:F-type H+-transporting ATPase subunit delta